MAPSPPLSLAKRTLAMVDSVLLPVQPKKIGIFADFIFAVSTMIFFFSSGESMEVSPVEPMISTALVPCPSWNRSRLWNAAKSTEPSLLNGVISATNEPVIFCLGTLLDLRSSTPSPLWGGWGGGREAMRARRRSQLTSRPPPLPLPTGGRGKKSYTHMIDEFLRRPFAPLRPQCFFGGDEIGAVGEVEPVAVGPMLMDAAPRIGPVVIDLAAQHMTADAPHVLVLAGLLEVFMAHADVVDVRHLEGEVIQAGLLGIETEEDVMIDVSVAAVAAVERADQIVLVLGVDVVRADQAQRLAEPAHGLAELRRHHHAMADALDVGRPPRQPHQFAGARGRRLARVQPLPLHRDRRNLFDAAHHLDLVAVRLGQPHPLAAAGLVDVFDARGAGRLGELLQVILAVDVIGDADEFRVALFGDVDVVRRIGAAHVERVGSALRAVHAETGEELLRHVEIGRFEPPVGDIGYFRPSHMCSPR